MPERHTFRQFETIALQWRALAEQRRAYFIELYESGRWALYYTEEDFVARVREAVGAASAWARVAPSASEQLMHLADRMKAGPSTFDPSAEDAGAGLLLKSA
jgi:uncharacterized repeat protein (TIGR03809 family)